MADSETEENRRIVRDVLVRNRMGLHARPAALLVKCACEFASDIVIARDGNVSDAKSTIGLLMLGAGQGTNLSITAQGTDALEAVDALEKLINDRFGEE